MPGFYIFFLPGNCLDLSNCPVATSGFQNVGHLPSDTKELELHQAS